MQNIDITTIIHGLSVAEHLSFRAAARMLGVQQSAVSRRIRSLEDVLGVSLFERHAGGVRLTTAGIQFFDRVRPALAQLDIAVKAAGAAGRGEDGYLRIGLFSSIATGFLHRLIRDFNEQHPDVALEISEVEMRQCPAFLRKGRLDVAFVMGTPVIPNCETTQLWTERLFAVLPQGHLLAERAELEWEALRDEHFIVRHSDPGPIIENYLIKRVACFGQRPNIQRFDVSREGSIHLVALGLGISLTTEATTACSYPGVKFCPLAGAEHVVPFSALWSPKDDNPTLRRFLSLARVMSSRWNSRAHDVMTTSPVEPAASILVGPRPAALASNGRTSDPLP